MLMKVNKNMKLPEEWVLGESRTDVMMHSGLIPENR